MANYFTNPITGKKQYDASFVGAQTEHGEFSFATTGETVEVPTYFGKILAAFITPKVTVDPGEQYFCDLVITNGAVTVQRAIPDNYVEYHFAIDNAQFVSNNLGVTPLMVSPKAMTLGEVQVYTGTTVNSGSPIFDLGDASDNDEYIESEDMAGTTDGGTLSCTIGDTAVADGDLLIAQTTGGDTDSPADWCISISAEEAVTATSALTFSYLFIGFH